MTMMSPVAAASPARTANPFPALGSETTTTSMRSARATSTVLSSDRPSIITTSSTYEGIRRKTHGRFLASFSVGITTLIEARGTGAEFCA
jgi:hypothetical protein